MSDQERQQEIDRYLEEVKVFQEIDPQEAEKLIEERAGHIVYIGRETCPYCRKFVQKLSPLAEKNDLTVHYLHAHHEEFEEEVNELRDHYDVPTVPGLLYSSDTAGLVVKTDSSLEKEEILEIVEAQ